MPLTGGLVSDVKQIVGKIARIDGAQVADTAKAILLRKANDAILAGMFGLAVIKQETGVVWDYITAWSIECERRAVRAVETKQGAFLPVCHYGSIHQVLV